MAQYSADLWAACHHGGFGLHAAQHTLHRAGLLQRLPFTCPSPLQDAGPQHACLRGKSDTGNLCHFLWASRLGLPSLSTRVRQAFQERETVPLRGPKAGGQVPFCNVGFGNIIQSRGSLPANFWLAGVKGLAPWALGGCQPLLSRHMASRNLP